MAQLYQDSIAICCKYGTPLLFITMTANTKWFEIASSTPPRSKSYNNPVETARVYRLKAKELIYQIERMGRFGKVLAYVLTSELQKRGLPHLHLMITLVPLDCPITPEQIDLIVLAEIPDPIASLRLHHLVTDLMMLGPCVGRPCWKKGCCNKGFPWPYSARTMNVDGAYPVYKRRNDGRTVVVLQTCHKFSIFYSIYFSPISSLFLFSFSFFSLISTKISSNIIEESESRAKFTLGHNLRHSHHSTGSGSISKSTYSVT
jgi:hypothetical protein